MAIAENASIDFFGTQDNLDSTSASVADAAFSISTDVVTPWTNDDDAPEATFTLSASWATETNIAGLTVGLYARLLNVVTTSDTGVPSADNQRHLLGVFQVPAENASDPYYMTTRAPLPNYKTSSEYEFYIQNNTGQTISAGWILYVTPITIGPHPA